MSVSKWRYSEECDGDFCIGDCDLCKKEPDETAIKNFSKDLSQYYNYISPVELEYTDRLKEKVDDSIQYAIEMQLGVKVDRNELIKAMNYDREQYKKGFENGYYARDREIVRCGECKHYQNHICRKISIDGEFNVMVAKSHFCAMGERKENNV